MFLASFALFSQKKLAQINDPDGFTNVRTLPDSYSSVIFKLTHRDYFYYEESKEDNWYKVTNMEGEWGYMHRSRILPINQLTIQGKTYNTQDYLFKIRNKSIGETQIQIIQIKHLKNPSCQAYINISNPQQHNFAFENIEALGGAYGIAFLENSLPNHLIIVKHGDYDGQTLIISEKGIITKVKGGTVYYLKKQNVLINMDECDIGYCGLSIYDLNKEKIIYQVKDEINIKIRNNNLYFIKGLDDSVQEYFSFDLKTLKEEKISETIDLDHQKQEETFPLSYELKEGCLCNQ